MAKMRKSSKVFRESPDSVVVNELGGPIEESNERLDAIEKLLKEHLYFIKDNKDDGKKTHKELTNINKTLNSLKSVGGKSGGATGVVPAGGGGGDGGTSVIPIIGGGGMFSKVKSKVAGLKKGFDAKKLAKRGGILGVIYGALDSVDDYKEVMKIDDNQELNLKQRISGATSGVVNTFGELAETLSGGIIKWDSANTLKSIDETINSAMAPVEEHFELFKGNFPKTAKTIEDGIGFMNNSLSMVQEGWKNIFDWTGKYASDFGDWAYEEVFGKEKQKKQATANEKANIIYNDRKKKEIEAQIISAEENRARYDKDSKVYEAFTKQIEGYKKQIEDLDIKSEQSKVNIKNINSSGVSNDSYYKKLGKVESNNNYGASNKYGYAGKYQFGKSTAQPYLDKMGVTWDDYKKSPEIQEKIIRMFTEDNKKAMIEAGIEPTELNMWIAHNQGMGGLKQILSGDVSSKVARNISTNLPEGGPATAENYLAQWSKKFSNNRATRVNDGGSGDTYYITNNNVVNTSGGSAGTDTQGKVSDISLDHSNMKTTLEASGNLS